MPKPACLAHAGFCSLVAARVNCGALVFDAPVAFDVVPADFEIIFLDDLTVVRRDLHDHFVGFAHMCSEFAKAFAA